MSGSNVPPGLGVIANGVGDLGDQYLNGLVQGACLLANLRNFVGLSQMTVWMIGTNNPGDGGQGMFVWNSSATANDDGGATTIAPYGQLTGRWIRNQQTITGPITQSLTGQFYQNQGASIDRFADRVLVGDAVTNDGNAPSSVQTDWLDIYQAQIGLQPVPRSQFACLQFNPGEVAVLGGAQSLNHTLAGQSTIGFAGYAYNNNATLTTGGWSYYGESYRWTQATSNSYGAELAVIQQTGVPVQLNPYGGGAGAAIGIQLDSGNGFDTSGQPGLCSATAAIVISQNTVDNSSPFLKGLLALNNSIAANAGGLHEVMSLPALYGIQWYNSLNAATSYIDCNATSGATAASLLFQNNGLAVLNATTGGSCAVFGAVPAAINWVYIQGNSTGNEPQVAAAGLDSTVDLVLAAQGFGVVAAATSVYPTLDDSWSLGTSVARWTEVWAVNGTIQTSDEGLKTDIESLPEAAPIIRAINPIRFRWKNGGNDKVPREIEVEQQVYETFDIVTYEMTTQADGTRRMIPVTTPARRVVCDEIPVLDENGVPFVDQLPTHRHGEAMMSRPVLRTAKIPRMERVPKTERALVPHPGRRTHWGFRASEIKAATPAGTDWGAYVLADDGSEHLRPDQMIPVLWKGQQEVLDRLDSLTAQIAALSARP